nr:hypothetical protein [Chloroflexota bacterium]
MPVQIDPDIRVAGIIHRTCIQVAVVHGNGIVVVGRAVGCVAKAIEADLFPFGSVF